MGSASTTKVHHALIVGASAGIGRAIALEVAPLVNKLTLASRSCPSDLITTIKQRNPSIDVTHEILDVSSLRDVRRFTETHKSSDAVPFDWIIMSPGVASINGRTETIEGLDVKMATHFYGRFMLIRDLLPTLDRPNVRVLNILAAAKGGRVDADDLDLKRTFSIRRCAEVTSTYSDLMVQAFAERAPHAIFMHACPGSATSPLANGRPCYLSGSASVLAALLAHPPDENAKFMLDALTDNCEPGWRLLGQHGEALAPTKFHTHEMKDIVWKHSSAMINRVVRDFETIN